MTIDFILASIEEYIQTHADFIHGQNTQEALTECKKRFIHSLNDYVDHRLEAVLDEHRRKEIQRISSGISTELGSPIVPQELNEIVIVMDAINNAPMPPEDPTDPVWLASYKKWYEEKRTDAIKHLCTKLESGVMKHSEDNEDNVE